MTHIDKPLVSVITPSWNSAMYLEQTILSVINQTYKNVEYIIIDGGSTDGTLEIIRKYHNAISYWVSEPDDGMYQAINKGMLRASGEIVAYLNSDDLYYPNTISRVLAQFESNPGADLIYGNLDHINEGGLRIFTKKYPAFNWKRFATSNYALIGQPAAFWRKELFEKIGPFDESMKMAADFDFFIRAGMVGRPKHVDEVLAAFRLHPESLTSSQLNLSKDEVMRIHSKYLPGSNKYNSEAIVSDMLFKLLNWEAMVDKSVMKLRKY